MSSNLIAESVSEQAPVEVRADARIAGAVGAIAAAVSIAYLTRAVGGGSWLDWALVLVTGAIAAAHLQSLLDSRVPLLVVDVMDWMFSFVTVNLLWLLLSLTIILMPPR